MGLTNNSVGINAIDSEFIIKKHSPSDKVIAIAGNPNVGKSTVFNGLTGMNQHTGNWTGKTVTNAQGFCKSEKYSYVMVDIPGAYSLMSESPDEKTARNFICFGEPDAVVVVCDATCIERNLNLALQIMEISENVIICVNLLDEAERKNIKIDLNLLSERLGVPVIGIVARKKKSLKSLLYSIDCLIDNSQKNKKIAKADYGDTIESAIEIIEPEVKKIAGEKINSRWLSLKLLDYDKSLIDELNSYLKKDIFSNSDTDDNILKIIDTAKKYLSENNISIENLKDIIASSIVKKAEEICDGVVTSENKSERKNFSISDRSIDRILTSRITGYPVMILMLAVILWITITGANYPSQIISDLLFGFEIPLTHFLETIGAPTLIIEMVVFGIYRVLAWVVSVMLPPMAIFFPLFTLLEDSGYLPRVAYNLDKPFKKCCACGKQALTMCMGFGCNAAGIVGCRIIDSPRERLIAIITNNFVPCNGRFPILIAVISMFFTYDSVSLSTSLISSLLLTSVVVFGIIMTFVVSKVLSKTILKGVPSSFTLELPPYRKPQIGKVIVRSIFDRTLFVLGRAVAVAAPAGLIIWLMANITIGDCSILKHCSEFLDPFAKLIGLDGVILIAFILGFPANEIVIPIIIMAYMSQGTITQTDDLLSIKQLLVDNGWTWVTAVNVMIFSLMHWPCSTTLMTIKKETASLKWTAVSFIVPAICGIVICFIFTSVTRFFI